MNRPALLDHVLVIDLECTCWEREAPGHDERQDIIEIGACLVDPRTGEIADADGFIVRPRRSTVSPFCERLTGISQAMVDHGLEFEVALVHLRERFGSLQRPWASWGQFDRVVMQGQCRDFGVEYPFSNEHFNLKVLHALRLGLPRPMALYRAIQQAGYVWEGQHHRGVDDARNTARLVPWVMGIQAPPVANAQHS